MSSQIRIPRLLEWLSTELEFPITRDDLAEEVGDVYIEAPDLGDSERLESIVERSGDTDYYRSASDLYESILCGLDEEYIGRKYYDDRGLNPIDDRDGLPVDPVDQSF